MQNFQKLLKLLIENEVRFVLIGGLAATAHGSSLLTEDVDVCASFDVSNMARLLKALDSIHPEHRVIGRQQPLSEGAEQLAKFKNLYLKTDLGYVDFLSEVAGVGGFEQVMRDAIEMSLFDMTCRVLGLDALIESKRAMARPKDKETVAQLKAIQDREKGRS